MKSLMQLLTSLTQDLGKACRVSTSRDCKTILDRVEQEGMSFLTITLPTFSKAFESALDNGYISSDFVGFKKAKRNWRIPAFLQEFSKLVFDPETGVLLDHPDPTAIYAIRQITLAMKKYRSACTPKRERKAMEQFVLTDLEVASFDAERPDHVVDEFARCASYLFGPVLTDLEMLLRTDPDAIVPRHGPGATANRIKANAKYDSLVWTNRLQKYFPASKFLVPNEGFSKRLSEVYFQSPRNETPVRVVSVPKTLKTPRIIGIEPVHMQYVQQGLLERLAFSLQRRAMLDSIGIRDQSPNQALARSSSKDQRFATLDLSEASDRVSNQLAQALFRSFPILGGMVQSCRSTHADVPGHGVIHLSKFASMGSALCFPIEAMVFLTIAYMGSRGREYAGSLGGRKSFLRNVRVYGDDIIVPRDMAQSVSSELEAFGLKVNRSKSFWTGKFRESCGGDFYDGVAVKPLYIKTKLPRARQHVEEIECTSAFRNHAYLAGLHGVVAFIDSRMERVAPYPFVSDKSPVIGRLGEGTSRRRLCPKTHAVQVRGLIPRRKPPLSRLDDAGALLKFFLKRGFNPIFAEDHLSNAGRPKSADMRLGWGAY